MRKWMSAGLVMIFVFTLAFSFTVTVTSDTATAKGDNCCEHHFCIETQTWAIGEWEWDGEDWVCEMNGSLYCQVECVQGP